MLVSLRRIFKFAFQDFTRNFAISLAVIVTMFLMLLSINLVLGINYITNQAAKIIENQIDISVYIKSNASSDMINGFRSFLMGFSEIKDVEIVSPEMALARFKERHKDDPKILEALSEIEKNPLGTTLVIKLHDISQYSKVLGAADHPSYKEIIEDKDYTDYSVLIGRVNNIAGKVRIASLILILFFGLISTLIIFNSIKMAIYNHREEIGIMKLVGASDAFVWSPFLFEGIFSSAVAVVLSAACVLLLVSILESYIIGFFGSNLVSLRNYFFANSWKIFGAELLVSVVLYFFSGMLAIRKYLAR